MIIYSLLDNNYEYHIYSIGDDDSLSIFKSLVISYKARVDLCPSKSSVMSGISGS